MTDTNTPKPETDTPAAEATPGPATAAPESVPAAASEGRAPDGDLAVRLETLRKERDDNHNHYLRALADLENYRRRVIREKDELRQFATRDLVEAIIPVFEGLSLANRSASTASDPQVIAQGVALVLEQFRSVLAAKGLTEINPAAGADFDPNQHESIAHGPSDTVPEEKVLQVVRSGFSLNGRVIRPASVVLSGGPAKA